jgi:hypothetical protein
MLYHEMIVSYNIHHLQLNYFKIGNEKIDINEWKHEKLQEKTKCKENLCQNKGKKVHFEYIP